MVGFCGCGELKVTGHLRAADPARGQISIRVRVIVIDKLIRVSTRDRDAVAMNFKFNLEQLPTPHPTIIILYLARLKQQNVIAIETNSISDRDCLTLAQTDCVNRPLCTTFER